MAREDLHFRLRIPEDLKADVEGAAVENRRSMTAEIVARLADSFDTEVAEERISKLEKELAYLKQFHALEVEHRALLERSAYHTGMLLFMFGEAVRAAAKGESGKLEDIVASQRTAGIFDNLTKPTERSEGEE